MSNFTGFKKAAADVYGEDPFGSGERWSAHHVVPRDVGPDTQRWLNDIGFDIEDASQNSIALPYEKDEAVRLGISVHRGSHNTYSDIVKEALKDIKEKSRTDDAARVKVEALVEELKKGLAPSLDLETNKFGITGPPQKPSILLHTTDLQAEAHTGKLTNNSLDIDQANRGNLLDALAKRGITIGLDGPKARVVQDIDGGLKLEGSDELKSILKNALGLADDNVGTSLKPTKSLGLIDKAALGLTIASLVKLTADAAERDGFPKPTLEETLTLLRESDLGIADVLTNDLVKDASLDVAVGLLARVAVGPLNVIVAGVEVYLSFDAITAALSLAADAFVGDETLEWINDRVEEIKGYFEFASCFPAGTRISMADGTSKPIEEIAVGDLVLAFDPDAGRGQSQLVAKPVKRLFHGQTSKWIDLSLPNDAIVRATPGHHFLSETGDFLPISSMLRLGGGVCNIVLADGSIVKATGHEVYATGHQAVRLQQTGSVSFQPTNLAFETTYNFEVEDFHTYVADGVRVHNKSVLDIIPSDAEIIAAATDGAGVFRDVLYLDADGHLVFVDGSEFNAGNTSVVARLRSEDALTSSELEELVADVEAFSASGESASLKSLLGPYELDGPLRVPEPDGSTLRVKYETVEAYQIFDGEKSGLDQHAPNISLSYFLPANVLDPDVALTQIATITARADGDGSPAFMTELKLKEGDEFWSTDYTLNFRKIGQIGSHGRQTGDSSFNAPLGLEEYTIEEVYLYRPHNDVFEESVLWSQRVVVADSASDEDSNPDLFIDDVVITTKQVSSGGSTVSVHATVANADPDDALTREGGVGAELVLYLRGPGGPAEEIGRASIAELAGGEIVAPEFYAFVPNHLEGSQVEAFVRIELPAGFASDSPGRLESKATTISIAENNGPLPSNELDPIVLPDVAPERFLLQLRQDATLTVANLRLDTSNTVDLMYWEDENEPLVSNRTLTVSNDRRDAIKSLIKFDPSSLIDLQNVRPEQIASAKLKLLAAHYDDFGSGVIRWTYATANWNEDTRWDDIQLE